MSKRIHRPCPWRQRRKFGADVRDYCTVQTGDHPPDAPLCDYCRDRNDPARRRIVIRKSKKGTQKP